MTLAAFLCAPSGSDDSDAWLAQNPRGHGSAETRSPGEDEHALVARIREGDEAAFEQLFRQHYTSLVYFAANYVRSPALAEEVVAEMFSQLWVNRASWHPTISTTAALYGATRRRAIDLFRSRNAEERRRGAHAAYEHWGMGAEPADAAWLAESEDERARVWRVISMLPPSQRTVIALRWRNGLSWDEIAVATETTVVAVKRQHSRALAVLRERYASHLR